MVGQTALVYAHKADAAARAEVASLVAAVLWSYEAYLLVEATDDRLAALRQAGYRVSVRSDADEIRVGAFAFSTVDPPEPTARMSAGAAHLAGEPGDEPYSIVQFVGPVDEAWKRAVEELGGTLIGVVPEDAFLTRLPASAGQDVARLPFVRWVGPYRPEYKISPYLLAAGTRQVTGFADLAVAIDPEAAPFDPAGNLEVMLMHDQPSEGVVAAVGALGGTVVEVSGGNAMIVALDPMRVEALASIPSVRWIGPYGPDEPDNDVAVDLTNVRRIRDGAAPFGLAGTGHVVAVTDSGLDVAHPDLSGQVAAQHSWGRPTGAPGGAGSVMDQTGHGTHVTGSIVGDGTASAGSIRGMAPAARVAIQSVLQPNNTSFNVPNNFTPLMTQARVTDGAFVHNNSWSRRNTAGVYTARARQVDAFVAANREYVILFSSSNSARDGNSDGKSDPDSVRSPGTAKNCITVGSAETLRPDFTGTWGPPSFPNAPINGDLRANNPHGLAASSGRGPTDDGRIKPDVVAPGSRILSTRSGASTDAATGPGGRYTFKGGTSMATPITAGTALLIREFLINIAGHSRPSAALVKALLINSATPMHGQYPGSVPPEVGPIPNNDCGWGLINLREAIAPARPRIVWFHDLWLDPTQSLATGQEAAFPVAVTDPAEPLKVTLVWTDPVPPVPAVMANDLQLLVDAPAGPAVTVLRSGNVEGAIVDAPAAGTYAVRVQGLTMQSPPQDFALVVSGAFTAPAAGTTIR